MIKKEKLGVPRSEGHREKDRRRPRTGKHEEESRA
jgi:hypothetical protein